MGTVLWGRQEDATRAGGQAPGKDGGIPARGGMKAARWLYGGAAALAALAGLGLLHVVLHPAGAGAPGSRGTYIVVGYVALVFTLYAEALKWAPGAADGGDRGGMRIETLAAGWVLVCAAVELLSAARMIRDVPGFVAPTALTACGVVFLTRLSAHLRRMRDRIRYEKEHVLEDRSE